MTTISKIKNNGIRVMALRNIGYNKKCKDIRNHMVNNVDLRSAFPFVSAEEPFELEGLDKHNFWNLVNNGKESKAEQMILNKYKK